MEGVKAKCVEAKVEAEVEIGVEKVELVKKILLGRIVNIVARSKKIGIRAVFKLLCTDWYNRCVVEIYSNIFLYLI